MPPLRKKFDPQPPGAGSGSGPLPLEDWEPQHRRQPYKPKEHWSESLWFWLVVAMIAGWFGVFVLCDWLNTLHLLP